MSEIGTCEIAADDEPVPLDLLLSSPVTALVCSTGTQPRDIQPRCTPGAGDRFLADLSLRLETITGFGAEGTEGTGLSFTSVLAVGLGLSPGASRAGTSPSGTSRAPLRGLGRRDASPGVPSIATLREALELLDQIAARCSRERKASSRTLQGAIPEASASQPASRSPAVAAAPDRCRSIVLVAERAAADPEGLARLLALAARARTMPDSSSGAGEGPARPVGSPPILEVVAIVAGEGALGAANLVVVLEGDTAAHVFVRAEPERPTNTGAPWSAPAPEAGARPSRDAEVVGACLEGCGVEVAVLGPVEVRGSAFGFERRPRLTELVVFLAMHPEGVTSSTWATALWPERRVPPQTIANRLSEARRALGFASDHRPRLRKVADRHLVADVGTDWQRFQQLTGPGTVAAQWHEALGLVRGRPFANLREGQWTAFEGFEAEIETAVVECALRFGEDALQGYRPEEACWAAHQALRASPFDERLYRLLMRAADGAGNRAGVEAAMRTLALVLEIDGDPILAVHKETAALYAKLTGRTGAPARST